MAIFTEILAGNKTSSHRAVRWTTTGPGDPASGLLEIVDAPNGKPRSRPFWVTEVYPDAGHVDGPARAFKLVKPDGTHYDLLLTHAGHDCTCAAGCFGVVKECVHAAAMKAVIACGWCEDPREGGDGHGDAWEPDAFSLECEHCGAGRLYEDAAGRVACDQCGRRVR